jgi:hypothetical protein
LSGLDRNLLKNITWKTHELEERNNFRRKNEDKNNSVTGMLPRTVAGVVGQCVEISAAIDTQHCFDLNGKFEKKVTCFLD